MPRIFLALLLLLPGGLRAAPASKPDEAPVAALYARSLAGDEQAVVDCIAALEKILAAAPNDQLARVYLGSTYTLRSRDLGFGKAKLDALRKGIRLMDEAAAAAPANANVLLNRAVTNQALPIFLGRRKAAREQLESLVTLVERNPPKLTPADRQLLYLNAGEAARHAGEKARAAELWQRGLAIEGDAKLAQEIKAAIAQP